MTTSQGQEPVELSAANEQLLRELTESPDSRRLDQGTGPRTLLDGPGPACQPGNQDTAELLAKVIDVIDPVTGTARSRLR